MSAVPSTLSSPTGAVVAQPRWPLRTTLGLAMLGLLALFAPQPGAEQGKQRPQAEQAHPRRALRPTWALARLAPLAVLPLLGPWLGGASPVVQDLRNTLAPPSAQHWLGTDVLGRSALARLAHAAQLSLGLALLAAGRAAAPGPA